MKRDIVTLVSNAHYRDALLLYSKLHSSSVSPNIFTFPCLLKACSKLECLIQGRILHTHLIKSGFHLDTYAATSLTSMYMKFQEIKSAVQVFDEMPQRNEASVGATISGFSQNGFFREAIVVFRDIGVRWFRPNSVMIAAVLSACDVIEHGIQAHCWAANLCISQHLHFPCLLKACSKLECPIQGRILHTHLIKSGFHLYTYAATALTSMYMKFQEIKSVVQVFDEMPQRNEASVGATIFGFSQNGFDCLFVQP